jgi:hypothetical protein
MDVAKAGQIVALMLSPTVVIAAALYLPRGLRALRRAHRPDPAPSNPPIEAVAADLRRLLRRHEALTLSADGTARAVRRRALEDAIADCATDAARALGVPCPRRPGRAPLSTADLAGLLRALAAAGVVLPPVTGLPARDNRV